LFAWGINSDRPLLKWELGEPHLMDTMWELTNGRINTTGMFARSPADFYNSGKIHRHSFPIRQVLHYGSPPTIVNRGVRLEIPLFGCSENGFLTTSLLGDLNSNQMTPFDLVKREKFVLAVISCSIEGSEQNYLGVPLFVHSVPGSVHYGRYRTMVSIPRKTVYESVPTRIHIDSHWSTDWCVPDTASGK